MSSNSSSEKIRPINFQFSNYQAYPMNMPFDPQTYPIIPNINSQQFQQIFDEGQKKSKVKKRKANKNDGAQNLFDFYNRQMLLIRDCDEKDIQIATKNPILFSEDIKVTPKKPQTINKIKNAAMTNNFIQKNKKIPPIQQTSQQYQQNQALFNMKKLVQQKNAKKKKIMDDIEQKLQKLEQQNNEYEKQQRKHEKQLEEMEKKHQQLLQQFPQTNFQQEQKQQKKFQPNPRKNPREIQMYMDLEEINHIIDEEHDTNTQLLNQIQKRVSRSRSKDKKNSMKVGQKAQTGWMAKQKQHVQRNFNANKTQQFSKSKKQQKSTAKDNIGLNSTMKSKQPNNKSKIPKNKTMVNTFLK